MPSRIVLYFGSFNPVHNGHTSVAEYLLRNKIAEKLWLVVSPGNPFKDPETLAPENDRLEMARIAVAEKLHGLNAGVCDIEFRLPRPSYTINTLNALKEEYPDTEFSILVGADIMCRLHEWKQFREIIDNHMMYVYPRPGYKIPDYPNTVILDNAPCWEHSSTRIREMLSGGENISGLVAPGVLLYILDNCLWNVCDSAKMIPILDAIIESESAEPRYYLLRAKLLRRMGENAKALNDFIRVTELEPANTEAVQNIKMLEEIFQYRYTDQFNP